MSKITQKSKKAKYVLFILIAVVIIFAIIGILSVLPNADGNPYIDLQPASDGFIAFYANWSAANITNAILTFIGSAVVGAFFMWLFFFVRGQQIKSAATTQAPGYAPVPTYPSSTNTGDQETTIS